MKARTCGCHSHGGFLLSPEGLEQRELGFEEYLAAGVTPVYIDSVGSVSGVITVDHLIFDDAVLEEQHRRFNNGS